MNCSFLGIILLEIFVPKLGLSNCGKSKQRLDWDLKIAENAKILLFRIFRDLQNAINLSIFIKFR